MTQTIQAAMLAGAQSLRQAGIPDATRDAQVLMAHACGITKDRLILAAHDAIGTAPLRVFQDHIAARCQHVPVSHLVGGRMFFDRWFHVTSDVLDPRPETEILVVEALAAPFNRVLDLGTGSGCILLTLLAERQEATGVGTDLSPVALRIAQDNAAQLGIGQRCQFREADWYDGVIGQFDLVVSNPPYIAAGEMPDLQPDVLDHEPRVALTDESDGLACYRIIIADARNYMSAEGRLIVEIGPTQAAAVAAMMAKEGFANITVKQDFDGRDRVVYAQSAPN